MFRGRRETRLAMVSVDNSVSTSVARKALCRTGLKEFDSWIQPLPIRMLALCDHSVVEHSSAILLSDIDVSRVCKLWPNRFEKNAGT